MKIDQQTFDDIVDLISIELEDFLEPDRLASTILSRLGIEKPEEQPKQRIATNWRLEKIGGTNILMLLGDLDDRRFHIANIFSGSTQYEYHAKLIAAAPELAKAASEIVDCIKGIHFIDDDKIYVNVSKIKKLRDAVKKAGYIDEG